MDARWRSTRGHRTRWRWRCGCTCRSSSARKSCARRPPNPPPRSHRKRPKAKATSGWTSSRTSSSRSTWTTWIRPSRTRITNPSRPDRRRVLSPFRAPPRADDHKMSKSPNSPGERQSFSGDGRPLAVVPHHREAEEAVLGAVLVSPETYFDLVHTLAPDDFFLHRNRWIWEAFTSLQEQRLPIDVLTVSEGLERPGRLPEVGGPAQPATPLPNAPSSVHAEAYGRMVEEAATRRRLLEAA